MKAYSHHDLASVILTRIREFNSVSVTAPTKELENAMVGMLKAALRERLSKVIRAKAKLHKSLVLDWCRMGEWDHLIPLDVILDMCFSAEKQDDAITAITTILQKYLIRIRISSSTHREINKTHRNGLGSETLDAFLLHPEIRYMKHLSQNDKKLLSEFLAKELC